jgi:Svf1-like N-terminal lipocalin domain
VSQFCLKLIFLTLSSGLHTTVQFNSKIFYPDGKKSPLWSSTPLSDFEFDDDKYSCYNGENMAIILSEDGSEFTIKAMVDKTQNVTVDLVIKRTAPGFQAGKDGNTYYGTDPTDPWGTMRHAWWPRATCKGTITTADGPIDFSGKALFILALQGMKPHHAG